MVNVTFFFVYEVKSGRWLDVIGRSGILHTADITQAQRYGSFAAADSERRICRTYCSDCDYQVMAICKAQ